MLRAGLLLLLASLAVAPGAGAQAPSAELARVVAVIDGATLALADGRVVRLESVRPPAPRLQEGAPADAAPGPFAARAAARLASLALGRELRLVYPPAPLDRYGRWRAQAYDGDGRWLQAILVSEGLLRVFGLPDARAALPALLALEASARAARRGLWSAPAYRVLSPGGAGRRLDSFQIVEGRVRAVAVVRGRGYLNFGDDWRRDFTATLAPAVRRVFAAEGLALDSYARRRVRVRGWLRYYNGPMIEISHPEQIEVLE